MRPCRAADGGQGAVPPRFRGCGRVGCPGGAVRVERGCQLARAESGYRCLGHRSELWVEQLVEGFGQLDADDVAVIDVEPFEEGLVEQPPLLRRAADVGGLDAVGEGEVRAVAVACMASYSSTSALTRS